MKLFLLIGQSNMAGRGRVEPGAEADTHPRVFMFTAEGRWALARDPVHFDKPEVAGVGLCSEFARTLVDRDPVLIVGLVPAAVGGTRLAEWRPGGALYAAAVARVRAALGENGPHRLAGILWHQGESDATADVHEGDLATYPERFAAMVARLRADLGDAGDDVPLVMGELGRMNPRYAAFNAATLPEAVRRVPRAALVTSEDLTDGGDGIHLDAASLRTFGRRYAEAFLRLTGAR